MAKRTGHPPQRRRVVTTAVASFAVVAGMIGLAYASVPLYRLFCQVTGFGGTPQIATDETRLPESGPATDRTLTVRFDSTINSALPWRFKPVQRKMTVKAGESMLAFYEAENLSDKAHSGTATFNVTPHKAAPYFVKVDCFCFTEQRLAPGQAVDMPVSFYIDPEILTDENTADVSTITLSYTFFRDDSKKEETLTQAAPAASSVPNG
ncbi:MAG: cytochrome c oxidase assembly protein [Rhodospirillales bacterium]|nr:cytochrome c oxidase assembly protein [Rhodospirillales bacterium]